MILASHFFRNFCFIHRCGKEWKGNRCHISAKPLQPPISSLLRKGGSGKKKYLSIHPSSVSFFLLPPLIALIFADIWIGLCISFLLIKIAAAALCFLWKKKEPEM